MLTLIYTFMKTLVLVSLSNGFVFDSNFEFIAKFRPTKIISKSVVRKLFDVRTPSPCYMKLTESRISNNDQRFLRERNNFYSFHWLLKILSTQPITQVTKIQCHVENIIVCMLVVQMA